MLSAVIQNKDALLASQDDFVALLRQYHLVNVAREQLIIVWWVKIDHIDDLETAIISLVCYQLHGTTCLSECDYIGFRVNQAHR